MASFWFITTIIIVVFGSFIILTMMFGPILNKKILPRICEEVMVVDVSTFISPSIMLLIMNRAVDIVASSLWILFLLPMMVIIALLLRLESSGPVIVRSKERYANDGKPIRTYSFRIFWPTSSNNNFQQPRLSRIGRIIKRLDFDGLPLIFNILFGDVSLIGTSLKAKKDLQAFPPAWYLLRNLPKPGIISLWSLIGPHEHADSISKLKCDVYYASHLSIKLNLIIFISALLMTFTELKEK